MDFTQLRPDEIKEFLDMYNVKVKADTDIYHEAEKLFQEVWGRSEVTEAVADLYLASQLAAAGWKADKLGPKQIAELAQKIGLPEETARRRIKRIFRFLPKVEVDVTIIPMQEDFSRMIRQYKYRDTLFLFNDDQEHFLRFHQGKKVCNSGIETAIIRPYQCTVPPQAAGIPIGVNGRGYQSLSEGKSYIDLAFDYIKQLVLSGWYRQVAFPANRYGNLATPSLKPTEEIREYIRNKIYELID